MNQSLVEVPAGSSVHVSASVKVFGLDKYDTASDSTGTYVEGYVYTDALSSDEGELGDSHSIPVLGYYGSWSAYALGSNPYLNECFYDPNRVSINTDTTAFDSIRFTPIRSAASGYVTITGDDGVEYSNYPFESLDSAYYSTSSSGWNYSTATISLPKLDVPEGVTLTVQLALAPEYYVTGYDEEGHAQVDWDSVDDGAVQTYNVYVDKTAPEITNVTLQEDVETGAQSLVVTAKDDRYVAAAFLTTESGRIIERVSGSPEGAATGSKAVMTIPLDGVTDDHVLVEVADYADKSSTYQINFNKEELSQPVSVALNKNSTLLYKNGSTQLTATVSPFGTHPDAVTWSSSNEDVATVDDAGTVNAVGFGTAAIRATSVKDPSKYAECAVTVKELDAVLYGALRDGSGTPQLFTWDIGNGQAWSKVVDLEHPMLSAAMDPNSQRVFICGAPGDGHLYEMDPKTGKTLNTYTPKVGSSYEDMTYSYLFSTKDSPAFSAFSVYQMLVPFSIDGELNSGAWPFFSTLLNYTNATAFVAMTSAGVTKVDADDDGVEETDAEMFLLLDNCSYMWIVTLYQANGRWSMNLGYTNTNLYTEYGITYPGYRDGRLRYSNCSMILCEEDGAPALYLAVYDGTGTNIYRMVLAEDNTWSAAPIGYAGDGVRSVALLANQRVSQQSLDKLVSASTAVPDSDIPQATVMSSETAEAAGSLNSVSNTVVFNDTAAKPEIEAPATASTVSVSSDEKTVTVDVLAKDAANNGLFSVDYDAASLTLNDVTFNTQYSSYKDADGKVTLGYVDLTGVSAGTAVASLTFTVNASAASDKVDLTVTEAERNDKAVENTETLAADLHTETKVENAKDATCTEDGYTGDTVCIVCGKVVAKGEVIKATGHEYKDGKCVRCGAAVPKTPDVKTGDTGIRLYVILAVLALFGACGIAFVCRRKRKENN